MKILSRLTLVLPLAALIVALAVAYWYLRGEAFQEVARATLISRMEQASGLVCTVERFRLDVFRGRFRLEGIALRPRAYCQGLTYILCKGLTERTDWSRR